MEWQLFPETNIGDLGSLTTLGHPRSNGPRAGIELSQHPCPFKADFPLYKWFCKAPQLGTSSVCLPLGTSDLGY